MTDVWQYLRGIDRPIVMYGTGNGADRIFSVFDRLGITVSAIFASDGFVRSRTFHGIPVVSYADVLKKYGGDFIIVLAFGSDRQGGGGRSFSTRTFLRKTVKKSKRQESFSPTANRLRSTTT